MQPRVVVDPLGIPPRSYGRQTGDGTWQNGTIYLTPPKLANPGPLSWDKDNNN